MFCIYLPFAIISVVHRDTRESLPLAVGSFKINSLNSGSLLYKSSLFSEDDFIAIEVMESILFFIIYLGKRNLEKANPFLF